MPRFLRFIGIVGILFFLSGCWLKGGGGSPLGFKQITPRMEQEMEQLIKAGCDKEYQYFDRDIAFLYSVIPGGGQWYTGEKDKAWLYLLSSPLIVPYIVSFQDAQNSVDYYNFKYTARFCRSKLKLAKTLDESPPVEEKKSSKKSRKKRHRRQSKNLPQHSVKY